MRPVRALGGKRVASAVGVVFGDMRATGGGAYSANAAQWVPCFCKLNHINALANADR